MSSKISLFDEHKILTFDKYLLISQKIRVRGYDKIVFTNGCFDIFHQGHLRILNDARQLAWPNGAVVVGVNSDESVRRLKGSSRPIFDEDFRSQLLYNLRIVDHVIIFDEDTPAKLISMLRPDIIVKGGDYKESDVIGGDIAMVSITPYNPEYSTSKIIEKICKNGQG